MWNNIETILTNFRTCFTRERAFRWFVAIIVGIMARSDALGFTSVIRDLCLKPELYECMMHFFRASSWKLDSVGRRWQSTVASHVPIAKVYGRAVLVGDGVKQSKEGRYMPGVKRLAQESETQTKPEMIHGHMWGSIGVLVGHPENPSCLPLSMRIHDGVSEVLRWQASPLAKLSHVVRMIREGCEASKWFGRCYYVLDRYFLSVPALRELACCNEVDGIDVDIVTKAKASACAWTVPEPRKPGQKGRPRVRGKKVRLSGLFESRGREFVSENMTLYGKRQPVRYFCIDLLWGQGLYRKIRFVLVEYGKTRSILATTDIRMRPKDVIQVYGRRFRIEHTFRNIKQYVGGMAYHFWTKAMPRLSHFAKKDSPDPLASVTDEKDRQRIQNAVRAIEMSALMACIATGILQLCSVRFDMDGGASSLRYQRTPMKTRPSEGAMMDFLRKRILFLLGIHAENPIAKIIRTLQIDDSPKIQYSAA